MTQISDLVSYMPLKLTRPLTVFDLETNGVSARSSRIVQIAGITIQPDGSHETFDHLVNPGQPIPMGASNVNGIYDKDVANCPAFHVLAEQIFEKHFLKCDLAGYNLLRFDIPFMQHELARADIELGDDFQVIDSYLLFSGHGPRKLINAHEYYLGVPLADAHDALGDVIGTLAVLCVQAISGGYVGVDDMSRACVRVSDDSVDGHGKLRWNSAGDAVLSFGKHEGKTLQTLVRQNAAYLRWFITLDDFPSRTKGIFEAALGGEYPKR